MLQTITAHVPRLANAVEVVSRAVAAAWRKAELIPVDVWADRYRELIEGAAAEPGPWRTDRAPHTREVMRSYSNPAVRRISLMWGSQLSKTECLYNCLFYTIDVDPHPTLFNYPTQLSAADASEDRFTPSLLATKVVARKIRGGLDSEGRAKKRSLKTRKISFTRMPLWFTWANSKIAIKGKPIGRAFSDELDEFPKGAIENIDARMKTYRDRKHVLASTPTLEGRGIHEEYCKGDQRHFEVPCPHKACGRFQELIWGQVRWVGGSKADPQVAKLNTWYQCSHCAKKIQYAQLPAMLLKGRWVREGEWIDAQGVTRGEPKVPETDHHSYRLNTLYSPFYAWGELAATFLEAGCDPSMDWWNNFGDAWRPRGERAEVEDLRRLAVSVKDGGYAVDEVPGSGEGVRPGALALTASIDVQRDRAYYEVLGWGERGKDLFLIRWGMVPINPGGDDLPELDFLRTIRFARRVGGQRLSIVCSAIDTGHNARRSYRWCRRHGIWAVPVKGEDAQHMPGEWKTTQIDKNPDGTPLDSSGGGLTMLLVNTWKYKEAVLDKLKPGAAAIPGQGRWHWPDGTSEEYFKQLTAEEFGINPKTRRQAWMLRPGRRANHFLDIRVYSLALGDYRGVDKLTAASLIAARQRQQAPPAVPAAKTAAPARPVKEPDDDESKSETAAIGARARSEWRPGYREEW